MPAPEGFTWSKRKNGDVVISHHHKVATILRNRKAELFLDDVDAGDKSSGAADSSSADQELMARLTGNYKRGNERHAQNHPRNRH